MQAFHDHLQAQLRAAGAQLDDIRYCPHLEGGAVAAYARRSDWRKPEPGMLLDLMRVWPVAAAQSLVVGDKDIDVQAARRCGAARAAVSRRRSRQVPGAASRAVIANAFAEVLTRAGNGASR